jgi:hypothetical protein
VGYTARYVQVIPFLSFLFFCFSFSVFISCWFKFCWNTLKALKSLLLYISNFNIGPRTLVD